MPYCISHDPSYCLQPCLSAGVKTLRVPSACLAGRGSVRGWTVSLRTAAGCPPQNQGLPGASRKLVIYGVLSLIVW